MLAHRIALTAAIAVLAAPATAFATNADGATPTATPLILELAVAALVVGRPARPPSRRRPRPRRGGTGHAAPRAARPTAAAARQ